MGTHRERERARGRGRGSDGETQSRNHLSVHQWVRSAIHESHKKPPILTIGPVFEISAALCGTTGRALSSTPIQLVFAHAAHCGDKFP